MSSDMFTTYTKTLLGQFVLCFEKKETIILIIDS